MRNLQEWIDFICGVLEDPIEVEYGIEDLLHVAEQELSEDEYWELLDEIDKY